MTMKTNKSFARGLLLLTAFLLSTLDLCAVTFDVDGLRFNIISQADRTVEVAIIPKSISYPSYSTYSGDYNIPATVTFSNITYDVIGIGQHAFSECKNLGTVTLPSSIKYIGFGAFAYSNITSIDLPESLDSIGAAAFRDCWNLTEFKLPKSLVKLESTVFAFCSNLKTVTILSENLLSIPESTFDECTSLENVVLPESVTAIGAYAFSGCTSLSSLTIKGNVSEIGLHAFYKTTSLSSLHLPESLTSIGKDCFYLSGIVNLDIPANVTKLPGSMFYGCKKLRTLRLPSNLTSLDKEFCRGCTSLESIYIPDGVTVIPVNCFTGCSSLSELHLPNSLQEIRGNAFSECISLTKLNIPEGTVSISAQAFYGCKISELQLPSTLKEIGGWAFGLGEMKKLTLPYSLSKIGTGAFDDVAFEEVVCTNPTPCLCEESVFKNETYFGTLYVPEESLDAYKATLPWSSFFNIKSIDASGINMINREQNSTVKAYINTQGQYNIVPFDGLNIIVFDDGTTKKAIIKK